MDDIDGNAQEAELNALNVGKTYKDATTGIVKQKDATMIHRTLGVDTQIQERNRRHTYDYQRRDRHHYSRDRGDSRERKTVTTVAKVDATADCTQVPTIVIALIATVVINLAITSPHVQGDKERQANGSAAAATRMSGVASQDAK